MLRIRKEVYEKVVEHVKLSYPHECCGVLVGKIEGDVKFTQEAYPIQNLNRERAQDRYNMDPVGLIKVEKRIASRGLQIIGIYHSHPDHPPRPSQTDLEYAWPIYSYIIFAIAKGNEIQARNWALSEAGTEFIEEEYQVSLEL